MSSYIGDTSGDLDDYTLTSLERKMKSRHASLVVGSDPKKTWKLLNEIGDGAFGKVYKARHRFTDQLAAIKLFDKCDDEDELEDGLIEVDILKDCKHRNIVRLYDAFYYDSTLWVSDFFDFVTLFYF